MAASNIEKSSAFEAWCRSSEAVAFMKEAAADRWRRMSAEERAAFEKDGKSSVARWMSHKGLGMYARMAHA